jgi:hypothetical protein
VLLLHAQTALQHSSGMLSRSFLQHHNSTVSKKITAPAATAAPPAVNSTAPCTQLQPPPAEATQPQPAIMMLLMPAVHLAGAIPASHGGRVAAAQLRLH